MSTRILSCFCPGLQPTVPCLSGLNSPVFWLLSVWLLISNTDGQAKELPTYKDNDFINDGQKIYINEENKKMFLEKLRKDVEVCFTNWKWWKCRLSVNIFPGRKCYKWPFLRPPTFAFVSCTILPVSVILSSWPSWSSWTIVCWWGSTTWSEPSRKT